MLGRTSVVGSLVGRVAAFLRPQESLVMQAKRMLTTISPESLMTMPHPSLAYAGHLPTTIPHDLDRPHIVYRAEEHPAGNLFNIQQMLLSEATQKISAAGKVLQGNASKAEHDKRTIEDGTRRSWFTAWKNVWDAQIKVIKSSRLSKEEKVSAIKVLIDDIKHFQYLTPQEKTKLINDEEQALMIFSAEK